MCEHICGGSCRRNGCNCECGEWHCELCLGTLVVSKTEWTGEDESYEVERKCPDCCED